jgi:type VI secretion system protein VasG
MIGAGGAAGQNDAANILKPALARGELRTIAATTWSEYKKYFEKDPALARRFQVVKVEEPTEARCQVMLRGVVPVLEKHHNVRILDEGLAAAVKFSHRYLPDRQLPDKAVSVLDTASALLSLGQNSIPPAVEDATREIDDCVVQLRVLEREATLGAQHSERLTAIASQKEQAETRLAELQARWEKERDLVNRIREIRGKVETAASPQPMAAQPDRSTHGTETVADPDALRAELGALNAELDQLQGETPLIRVCVDANIVGGVVSAWTGIPIGKMLKDEVATVLALESHLGR